MVPRALRAEKALGPILQFDSVSPACWRRFDQLEVCQVSETKSVLPGTLSVSTRLLSARELRWSASNRFRTPT